MLFAASCSGPLTHRIVETPAGENVTYGSPRDWSYSVEALPERDVLRLRVTHAARCDRIPVTLMHRVDETLDGDKVVKRTPMSPRQSANPPQGDVECERGYAARTTVELRIADEVFQLGTTNSHGVLAVNLSDRLEGALYDERAPATAEVTVRGPKALASVSGGSLSLASLAQHESTVRKAVDELASIIARGGDATPQDVHRSYVLYSRLRRLAPDHPDFRGSAARFWELFRERKEKESARNLTRNLGALKTARGLLKDAGSSAFPLYIRAAVTDGTVSPQAVEWAEWQLLSAIMESTTICAKRFSWTALPNCGFASSPMLAARYLQFAFGDTYAATANRFCTRTRP